ncbi:MAG: glycosyltransferase family 9 protein [Bacteriovoracaceae bacterium]|nr:glycosyltransferase family 9 protein [Bacteriovoracaceae bacterium]
MSENNTSIGIIQLTRIGDVIQTFQAAKQLKTENPQVELTLIARREFAKGLEFLLEQVFSHIVYIDIKDLIKTPQTSLSEARGTINDIVADLNKLEFDALINLSFSKSSGYFASMIQAKHKLGLTRTEQNQISIEDNWSQYVFSSVMNSELNPFNLVDIFKYIIGAKKFSPEYKEKQRENKIVIHPFASLKKKHWGVNKWVDLCYKLLKENPEQEIHIVGGKDDIKNAQTLSSSPALKEFSNRIINNVGQSTIKQTYELLERAKILVCHDSMVSHLAAVSQTPTIVLSLGPVRPSETTPYHENVLNLAPKRKCFPCKIEESCDLLPCHKDISHQLTSQLVGAILKEETLDRKFFTEKISPFYLQNVAIYAPHFNEMGMELIDITESSQSVVDVFKTFYKIVWAFYFKEQDLNYSIPDLPKESLASLSEYAKGCSYIYELYGFGMKYSNEIIAQAQSKQPDVKVIQDNIAKMAEMDELCAITKQTFPLLKPVIDYFFVNKANAKGRDILEITQSNLLSFYDGQNMIKVIFDLIESITADSLNNQNVKEV